MKYSTAQVTFQKTFDGTNSDYGYSVKQTSDGGYIISGCRNKLNANSYDIYLIKIDGNGDTLWTKDFGGTGDDYGISYSTSI